MADAISNLKVRFSADTKNFKKEMDSGQAAVSGFSKQAGGAIAQLASMFGINMGEISQSMDTAKKQANALSAGFKGAAESSGFFSKALKILKLALISSGIGVLIVALGSLATYFTKTQRGADKVGKVMASIGAIADVIKDRFSALGENILDAFTHPKKAVIGLWEAMKTNIVNRIQAIGGLFSGLKDIGAGTFQYITASIKSMWSDQSAELAKAKSEFKSGVGEMLTATIQLGTGLDKTQQKGVVDWAKNFGGEMKEEAKAAWSLKEALQALKLQEIELITVQSKRKRQIEELKLAAKDETKTIEERQKSLADAMTIEEQLLSDEIALQAERVRILTAQKDLGESLQEDLEKLADEEAKLNDLRGDSARRLKEITSEYNSLTRQIEANSEAIIKNRQAESKDMKPLSMAGENNQLKYELKLVIDENGKVEWRKVVKDLFETEKLQKYSDDAASILKDVKSTTIEAAGVIDGAFNELATGIGESLGLLISGAEGAQSVNQIFGNVFGTLAVNLGKVVVAAGLAFFALGEAFQAAITNPATALLAVAAGTALIAVGTAVKSSISNVAAGGSGMSLGNSSGTYDTTGGAGNYSPPRGEAQPITIRINGEFRQKGKDLVAVVDQEVSTQRIRK